MNSLIQGTVFIFGMTTGEADRTTAISFVHAKEELSREVAHVVDDPDLLSRAYSQLFTIHRTRGITPHEPALIAKQLIKEYYAPDPCELEPLPEALLNDRYGNLSVRDMRRVFYVTHTDYQEDGWTCGIRAVFGAAALEKAIESGSILNHEELGSWCSEFREEIGIKGAVDYIRLRTKIDNACSLLRADPRYRMLELISQLELPTPDLKELLNKLHPGYFFVKGARALLRLATPRPLEALSLTGKSNNGAAQACCGKIVELIVQGIAKDRRLKRKYQAIAEEIKQFLDRVEEPGTDLRECIQRMGRKLHHEVLIVALNGGCSGLRKTVDSLCHGHPELAAQFEKVREIASLVPFDAKELQIVADSFALEYEGMEAALDSLCATDQRLKRISDLIGALKNPQLLMAVVLLASPNSELSDVVSLLRLQGNKNLETTWNKHDEIMNCLKVISRTLEKNDQEESIESIIVSLRRVKELPDIEQSIRLLTEKNLRSEQTIRDVRDLLLSLAQETVHAALKELVPTYPSSSDARLIGSLDEAIRYLKAFECKYTSRAIKILQRDSSIEKAIALLAQGNNAYKDDVCALLRSDHTLENNEWTVDKRAYPHAYRELEKMKRLIAREEQLADPEHILQLATHKDLKLQRHRVHIIGDHSNILRTIFGNDHPQAGQGIRFDERELGDPILFGMSEAEQNLLARNETEEQLSHRVEEAIRTHLNTTYLNDTSAKGVHHFFCNINGYHWIVISVVKFADKKPILVCYDSKNIEVTESQGTAQVGTDCYISFLFNKFLRSKRK